MQMVLRTFLWDNGYFQKFKPFIKTKTTVTQVSTENTVSSKLGEQPIRYKFKGELPRIITEFLGKNGALAEKLERNEKVEKAYLKIVSNCSYKYRGREQGGRYSNIHGIFDYIFDSDSLLRTSIIKQYAKRYQHIIEKAVFTEEQIEIINIGAFFLTVAYYLAKQEKIKTQKGTEKSKPEDSSTKNTDLDNILNTPHIQAVFN